MPTRAIVGRFGDNRDRGARESLRGEEPDGGARPVQDNNVVNPAAAQRFDQERKGSASEAPGNADNRASIDEREAVPERPEAVDRVTRLEL